MECKLTKILKRIDFLRAGNRGSDIEKGRLLNALEYSIVAVKIRDSVDQDQLFDNILEILEVE